MEYSTIVNGIPAVRPTKILKKWDGSQFTTITFPRVTWMSPPVSSVEFYDPELRTIKHIYDPSKGRKFNKLKSDGVILSSPYQVVNITTQDFLVACNHSFKGYGFLQSSADINGAPVCVDFVDTSSYLLCTWTEQGDLSHWSRSLGGKSYVRRGITQDEIQDAIVVTQQEALSDALSGYDVLTDLAELKKTLAFVVGAVGSIAGLLKSLRDMDPKAWKKGKSLSARQLRRSSDKSLRALGERWLQYRYALMPIIYSIEDIYEASKGDIEYKSSRSRRVLQPSYNLTDSAQILLEERCIFEDTTGTITVRSFIKQRFGLTGLANLFGTRLTLNPFKTAYELVPLSFVLDWAVNLGDYITNLTTPSFADEMVCLTSIRDQTVKTIYLVDKSADIKVSAWPANTCIGAKSYTETFRRNVEGPLRTTITNSYNRFPYSPEAKVVFDLNLNWKRILDALALSYKPSQKILRSLK